jgi:hypothetical protein
VLKYSGEISDKTVKPLTDAAMTDKTGMAAPRVLDDTYNGNHYERSLYGVVEDLGT